MAAQEDTNKYIGLDGNRVSLTEAIRGTNLWRDQFKEKFGGSANLTKAFFIPMEDLSSLVNKYKEFGATGSRAYLAFVQNPAIGRSELKLFLVPATEEKDFCDIGIKLESDVDTSSVYDFTMPCPDTCPVDSPLNP